MARSSPLLYRPGAHVSRNINNASEEGTQPPPPPLPLVTARVCAPPSTCRLQGCLGCEQLGLEVSSREPGWKLTLMCPESSYTILPPGPSSPRYHRHRLSAIAPLGVCSAAALASDRPASRQRTHHPPGESVRGGS